jgi:hypothetical protein
VQNVLVPTLNDGQYDFLRLFQIWETVSTAPQGTRFDFSYCTFLRPSAVAFLGGLARLAQHHNYPVTFAWETISGAVMANLCQNGFASSFGHPSPGWNGNSIPFREDRVSATDPILDYLTDLWLGRGWVQVSPLLKDAIVGKVWEIYTNSFEHSASSVGVYSCGQYFQAMNQLALSVVDFGMGIPTKIRRYLQSDPRAANLLSSSCLEWAFQSGNTTSHQPGVARGLGLDLLKEFIRINQGSLEIYSNNAYAIVDRNGERFQDMNSGFAGTAVLIKLNCDETLYHFRGEFPNRGEAE